MNTIENSKQLPSVHLRDLCGDWVSPYRSPPVKIYRENRKYYLTLFYRQDRDTIVEITCRIYRYCKQVYIKYFEDLGITYDKEKDVLQIAIEGKYIRQEDN